MVRSLRLLSDMLNHPDKGIHSFEGSRCPVLNWAFISLNAASLLQTTNVTEEV